MQRVSYHIEHPSPEARFVLRHLLVSMFGEDVVEVVERDAFNALEGPKLCYGMEPAVGAFHLEPWSPSATLDPLPTDPEVGEWQGIPTLFPVPGGDVPFDPLAGTFFHLCRIEEDELPRDAHDRPVTNAMHAARHGYLHRPIVDEWMMAIHAAWHGKDRRVPAMGRTYGHTATMDADNGAMYLGRPLWRTAGGMARDILKGRPHRVLDRLGTLTGSRPDPYAVHRRFVELAKENKARTIINFMAAPYGEHDHAVDLHRNCMRNVLSNVVQQAEIGVHPGYSSSVVAGAMAREKAVLERVSGVPVVVSRQHFLRFRTPGTQRELIASGIQEDHSMGLADRCGFRAGTCTPYPFFDREAREQTPLMIHPFAVMDSALAYNMKLTPTDAVKEAKRMVDAVRRVNGRFISVWHERFLSGYGDERGWGIVAPEVIAYARP